MSEAFRELLKKVGSGVHTGKDLSRAEAQDATQMMLRQEATPAQIGAFMIAHRIKRPTPEELAGILDAYDQLGPQLQPIDSPRMPTVLGLPYDGRSRTAPLGPITALILAAADCPVILHGGDRMPTKYGIPLIEIWQRLGVDWTPIPLAQIQQTFAQTHLGFVYLPQQFPLAQGLVPYRDQIGKRPPFATIELFWSPYSHAARKVVGYVHPPTERMAQAAFAIRGSQDFITVKGLEGSCDLPRDRTAIIGLSNPEAEDGIERLLLHPRDYDLAGPDVPLESATQLLDDIMAVLKGHSSELMKSALWNGGFYLWQCGACPDMAAGLVAAEVSLTQGHALKKLQEIKATLASFSLSLKV